MIITFLHVSDFHLRGGATYDQDVVLRALLESVRRFRENGRAPDLVFATGDIAFSGLPEQYAIASALFDELLDAVALSRDRLFVIPGNHDVDRTLGIGLARTLESREEADAYFDPAVPKGHLVHKLGAFIDWHDAYFAGIRTWPRDTTCGPPETLEVNDLRLAVVSLNSALFCQDDGDHERLLIGRRCLGPAIDVLDRLDADVKVALIHHPVDWLSPLERGNVKRTIQGSFDLLLRGHLHEPEAEDVVSPGGQLVTVAAGAAYQTRKWPNRALYGRIEPQRSLTVFPIRYEDEPREIWTVDPSIFSDNPDYEGTFELGRSGAPREAVTARPEPAPKATSPIRSNIRALGLPFTGREDLLEQIGQDLGEGKRPRVVILHGQPGVGKSELAREFARRAQPRYPGGTFLVPWGSGNELIELSRIGANILGLEFAESLPLEDRCMRVLVSLGSEPTLLIYDNPRDLADVEPWLPLSGQQCDVLITSIPDLATVEWRSLLVPPLDRERSLELVERVAGAEVAARVGGDLAIMAAGLPVQIVPACRALAYEYRRGRLDQAKLALADEARSSFQVVYDTLERGPRLLLHAALVHAPDRIVRDELCRNLEQVVGGATAFDQALDVCRDLRLVEGERELRMHQLLASFLTAVGIGDAEPDLAPDLADVRSRQWMRFVEFAGAVVDDPTNADATVSLLGYAGEPEVWELTNVPTRADAQRVGAALYAIGRFDEARAWYEQALAEAEAADESGSPDHEKLSNDLHAVGTCLASVGRFEEARPWFERAVAEAEQGDVHGRVDHDSLGRSLHQVGVCLSSLREFEEARPWFERAVAEKEQGDVHGRVDHDSLGRSLHEVGFCLSSLGEFEEARPWFERAVAEKEQGDVHGRVDHASLGRSLHEVGVCLSSLREFEEARPWFERAVAEAEQGDVHGRVDHASLGRSLHQVGFCLSSLREFGEARPWFERAVAEKEQGDVHGRVDAASVELTRKALAANR